MKGYFILVIIACLASNYYAHQSIGCYKHDSSDQYLLFSDKVEHRGEDFYSGVKVDWNHFQRYLTHALYRCEDAAAKQGRRFFSFRFFGICHGLDRIPRQRSQYCIHHSYQQCMRHHTQCVGSDEAEYVYKVTKKITSVVVPGRKIHHNIFCEHRGSRVIYCKAGEVIQITQAYYGRTSKNHCGYKFFFNTNCAARRSEAKIKASCNNKQSCRLNPHNSVYGDPCKLTVKYIDVQYICKPKPSRKKIMCEHRGRKVISCGRRKIKIAKAFYGRSARNVCGYRPFYNLHCKAPWSEMKIKSQCNGKHRCRLNPHNNVYGDPCRNTVKYISVNYVCVR